MLIFKDILGHEQIKEHFQNAAAIQDTANTPDKVTTVKPVLPTETISAKNSCEPSDNE